RSGIVLVVRLLFFIAAVMVVLTSFEASLGAVLSIATVFGTAIGLAFSTALSNIVSGLYVLTSRPFRVGDYVRIGNVEGIVREITLNYTRILLSDETVQLVPNNKVVGSEVTNFRIDLSKFVQAKVEESEQRKRENASYRDSLDDVWKQLKTLTKHEEAYRYTFDFTLHQSHSHADALRHFDTVCEKWTGEFLVRPTYVVWEKPTAAITYRFAYIVSDPMMIVKRGSDFLADLVSEIYKIPISSE
ncbi:MAG: mechanosensitive ion channel family protein, partial [Promethearchaeota archaeon]